MNGPCLSSFRGISSIRIDPASGLSRDPARPAELRNAAYAERYDWDTLFYDVYRAGRHVVLQGPPLLNLLEPLKQSAPFAGVFKSAFGGAFRPLFPRARHFGQKKRGEIWLASDADRLHIEGPIGTYNVAVQPDMAPAFADRRVITTLSKDNDLRWITDWVRFYRRYHGADGVLFYDNGSTTYSMAELQAALEGAAEGAPALAVSWPFPYGPQGGLAGAVNGIEADWDSDFCQTGSLQHARHRFLRHARSVLNVDIDEIVIGDGGQSIFAATETSRSGFTKFSGRWISTHAAPGVTRDSCRHADFLHSDLPDECTCPPKWCLVPGRGDRLCDSWSVHNLFGAKANRVIDPHFTYRHMRGITNSWKEERWTADSMDRAALPRDTALEQAFSAAGLSPSTGEADGHLEQAPQAPS